jgi:hypothetical protein
VAGVAPDSAELARQLDDAREQQRAISGVLRAVARSGGLQAVLDEVVQACQRLCKADQGALYLLQDRLLHAAAHHGFPEAVEYDSQHPHALARTTAAGRAGVTDLTEDQRARLRQVLDSMLRERAGRTGGRSSRTRSTSASGRSEPTNALQPLREEA